jgi:hypothetical protein
VSQQEFSQQPDNHEIDRQTSYYRFRGKGRSKSGMPKDEPVEDDGLIMQRGYRAQEYGSQEQSVPDWARPQKNNHRGVLIVLLIVAGLLLIKPLLIVAGILLALLGITIGLALFAIIFPLVLLAIILGCAVLVLRVIFGRAFRPQRFYDRRYWRRYRRGYRW